MNAPAASPDAELIRLCAEFHQLEADYRRLLVAEARAEDSRSPDLDAVRTALEAGAGLHAATMEAITELPARTREGLRAKARATMAFYTPDFPKDYPCERMVWSVMRDAAEAPA